MQTVERRDFLELIFGGPTGPEKMKRTEEGFLQGIACVTNIGIFPYMLADGSLRYELRLPEEVFAEESLETLKGKPLTDDHPDVKVDPKNVKDLGVGSVGTEITHDDQCVYAPLTFLREDAIRAIENRKRALSCGYTCELDFTSGVKWGMRYDCIQRKIRYNHVALVDRGRAGDDAVLRMDGAGWHSSITPTHQQRTDSMKTIHLDNVAYQADEAVIAALQTAKNDATKAQAELSTISAKVDAAVERADKAESEKSALQANLDSCVEKLKVVEADKAKMAEEFPAKVDAAVKERLEVLDMATKAGVEVKPEMTADSIKREIVLKTAADAEATKLKLDAGDATYLKVRYDIACEELAKRKDSNDPGRRDSMDIPPKDGHQDKAPETAKQKHDKALQDAWKN